MSIEPFTVLIIMIISTVIVYKSIMYLLYSFSIIEKDENSVEYNEIPEEINEQIKPENTTTPYKPDQKDLGQIIEERRCCKMNGRNGDQYCDICGRVIPEEYRAE